MQIIIPRNSLIEELFPEISNYKKLTDSDIALIKEVYTFGTSQPDIEIEEDFIKVVFDEDLIQKESKQFEKVIRLSEGREYGKALKLVDELIEKSPAVSDYYRVKGQILSDQGKPKEAIDELIEAVRLNPENDSALIMLGNIYARDLSDTDTAISFFERVLEVDPDNYLAINNIGGNLANIGEYDEAKRYFELALELNPDYPNTLYGLALLESKQNNSLESFNYSLQAFSKLDEKKQAGLFRENFKLINEESRKSLRGGALEELVAPYKKELEEKSGKKVVIESSPAISTPAKIEIAEVHHRDVHIVKYQERREAVTHLVMHELGHLDRQIEARNIGKNQLFTTNNECEERFKQDNVYIKKKLEKKGFPPAKIDGFIEQIFHGLNSQIYNTPIDLFIEQKLFYEFPELRPYQFISLLNLEQEYIQSATNKEIQELVPKKITRTNKILSLVNTIQFRELFNIDLVDQFNPTRKDISEANELYKEWLAYYNDDQYGVEYEMINLWAEDFGLSGYFNLIDEETHSNDSFDSTVNKIENDPLSLVDDKDVGKEQFSNQGAPAGEMAATMYIVDALQHFEDKDIDEIRKIGFEIGMLGRSGIDTNSSEKKYSLNSISGKKFSGLHLLAYMYTAFKAFEPDMDVGIDFEEEYKQAKQLYKKGL